MVGIFIGFLSLKVGLVFSLAESVIIYCRFLLSFEDSFLLSFFLFAYYCKKKNKGKGKDLELKFI